MPPRPKREKMTYSASGAGQKKGLTPTSWRPEADAKPRKAHRPRKTRALLSGLLALSLTGLVGPSPSGAQETYRPDGLTSQTAAASCWEIKQQNPQAKNGSYWLWTPELGAPQQFYCDQEREGGGWLLIGRGREGWSEDYTGKGDPAQLHQNPEGPAAFAPVQLSSSTVKALTGQQKISDLTGGVRIRRAANQDGSRWQEVTLTRAQASEWTWTLSATQTWKDIHFRGDSPTVSRSNRKFSALTGQMVKPVLSMYQINFLGGTQQDWKLGFAYGPVARGQDNHSSYLWSKTGRNPIPFAQVYLRPTLTQADLKLTDYPQAGTSASQRRALPNSYSAKVSWRTSETTGSGKYGENNTYVQAINQVGNTVFTGGDFAWVENAQTGEKVQQKFLAAYDVTSGELVRSFKPQLNGQVKSLAAMPNGSLAVGGEFTQVNGEKISGLVFLDPVTGQIDRSYNFGISNRGVGSINSARSLQVQGDYLYVGGAFSHVVNTKTGATGYARNAGRFKLSSNQPDASWRPYLNGTVNGISAAEDGQTVAAAGHFTQVNGARAWKLALMSSGNNGSLAKKWEWKPSFPVIQRQGFHHDVEDMETKVWAAGSEHLIHLYDKTSMSRLKSAITIEGGDFHDLYRDKQNQVIYGSCHCNNYMYEGADTWPIPWNDRGVSNIYSIRLTTAFDAVTGQQLGEFAPNLRGPHGDGVWAQFVDSTGTFWAGGDINKSMGANGLQKTVGFARFSARDTTPPPVPTGLSVTSDGKIDNLTWKAASKGASYQVLRNNRVIATVSSSSYQVEAAPGARYLVRSVDASGNFSASTPAVTASAAPAPIAPSPSASPSASQHSAQPSASPSASATPSQPDPLETEEPAPPAQDQSKAQAPEGVQVMTNPQPLPPFKNPLYGSQQVLPSGAEWQVAFGLKPGASFDSWRKPGYAYDTADWYRTYSSVGWGEPRVTTLYQFAQQDQPTSMLLRKELDLNLTGQQRLLLTTYADDAFTLWVNGHEYSRVNMDKPLSTATLARQAVDFGSARRQLISVSIPAHELRQGKNLIAVMVSSNQQGAGTTFDMIGEVR